MAVHAGQRVHAVRGAVFGAMLCLMLGGCLSEPTQLGKTATAPVVVLPTVSSTAPGENASQVALNAVMEATFTADITLNSVTTDTFTLYRHNTPVAATVQFDGATATLTPDTALTPSTLYRLELSDGIVDTDGNALTPHAWHFYAAGSGWTTEQLIEDHNAGHSYDPNISLDPNGNAVAVWLQRTGSRYDIAANHYSADTGNWGTPSLIESDDTGSAFSARVAMDASGNAIAVWVQSDGTRYNTHANRYNASNGTWGSPVLIEFDDTDSAFSPQLAVDSDGNAVAVWLQGDGSVTNTVANHFNANSGTWGTPTLIESGNAGDTNAPQVDINAGGDAVVVWEYFDGTQFSIAANTFDASSGLWRGDVVIEVDNAQSHSEPDVSIDPNGNATAVWLVFDGTRVNVSANHFDATAGTWGTASLIEFDDAGSAYSPKVTSTSTGDSIAIWTQNDGTDDRATVAHFNAASDTWDTPVRLNTADPGSAYAPTVEADANGNAIALWRHNDGTLTHAVASRFSVDAGTWNTAIEVESENTHVNSPALSVNGSGQAMAAWQMDATPYDNITANHFEPAAAP